MRYSNCEVIIVFDPSVEELRDSNKLKAIYKILMTYRFPMSQNPENKAEINALSADDAELLRASEHKFIQQKIHAIDSRYQLIYIPKSLYQLFYISFKLDQLYDRYIIENDLERKFNQVKQNYSDGKLTPNECDQEQLEYEESAKIDSQIYRQSVVHNLKLKFSWSLHDTEYYNYCKNYLNRMEVFNEWIKFNDAVLSYMGSEFYDLKENLISILVDQTVTRIIKIAEVALADNYLVTFDTIKTQLLYFKQYSSQDPQFSLIKDIINLEWTFKDKPFSVVYRGVSKTEKKSNSSQEYKVPGYPNLNKIDRESRMVSGKKHPHMMSYSDGVFGGFCRDRTGMCFFYLLEDRAGMALLVSNDLEHQDTDFIFIPPVPGLATINGDNEFHHVRSRLPNNLSYINTHIEGLRGGISDPQEEKNFQVFLTSSKFNDLSTFASSFSDFLKERTIFIKECLSLKSKKYVTMNPYHYFHITQEQKAARKALNKEIVSFRKVSL